MCGIAGIWNFEEKLSKDNLITFTNSINHRGMDDSGYELYDNNLLGLGHRRLSILDLSIKGRQPMDYGNYSIVFNGEIFNFQELKSELEEIGYKFNTNTDTEVLLVAYHEWGEKSFHKFNGMWAFAIFNKEKEELILCSDRYGIKPLYYSSQGLNRFSFASETLAFSKLNGFNKVFDNDLLDLNIKDEYAIEPFGYTIFKDIYRLLPGHIIKIKKNETPQQERWYDVRDCIIKEDLNFDEAVAKFKNLFKNACSLRLRSDVPIATALSGGLDSSVVYGQIKELISKNELGERVPKNIHQSFTMTFPHWEKDESPFAKKVLKYHNENGNFVKVDSHNLSKMVEKITIKSDFITTNPLLPIYQVYASMKASGATVSMDGHGADELMFGYKTMLWNLHSIYLAKKEKKKLIALENYIVSTYEESKRASILTYIESLHSTKSKITSKVKRILKSSRNTGLKSLSDKPYNWDIKNSDEICLSYFFEKALPPILRNFDKASMLAGVEVRMPFMDYRIVEFCFSLPTKFLVDENFNKLILRESGIGLMPEDIRTRVLKNGFQSPIEYWLENDLSDWAKNIEASPNYKNLFPVSSKDASPEMRWKRINAAILKENEG